MEWGACRAAAVAFPGDFSVFMSFQGFDTPPAADPDVPEKSFTRISITREIRDFSEKTKMNSFYWFS
jgi:hypothetical protein